MRDFRRQVTLWPKVRVRSRQNKRRRATRRHRVETLEQRALLTVLPAGFAELRVADGLDMPTAMVTAPEDSVGNDRIYVAEQGGVLKVVENDQLLNDPLLTLEDVHRDVEAGLLGVALDPQFNTNRHIYLNYTTNDGPVRGRIVRYTLRDDFRSVLEASEKEIFEFPPLQNTGHHLAGAMQFGVDGKLYVTVGDNISRANAPSLTTVFGKILRLNPDGSIPSDNPFYDQTSGDNRAIWAKGFRNPFSFAIQPGTGLTYINDVGEATWEEINEGIAGRDYGWPETEGPHNIPRFEQPVHAYQHVDGQCSIIGAAFYNPPTPMFPSDFEGDYFFGDFCARWIRRLDPETGVVQDFANDAAHRLVDLDVDANGNLYYLSMSDGGGIYKISFTGTDEPTISQQPDDTLVSAGASATFSVRANGEQPLAYQWLRNGQEIAGANEAVYTLVSASLGDHNARFSVRISNNEGAVTSEPARLSVTTDQPPSVTIDIPTENATYRAGDTITFAGNAVDPETGVLPPSAMTWTVDFHHDAHRHPFRLPTRGITGDSFQVPTTGETDHNVWFRIHLTATDSVGLTTSTFRDVHPVTSELTLDTEPTGLQLRLDGSPLLSPSVIEGVVGLERGIDAAEYQLLDGTMYRFASWSDGGSASHNIATPENDTTFTAVYEPSRRLGDDFVRGNNFLEPGRGSWQVSGDRYVASAASSDAIALLDQSVVLPGRTLLGSTVRTRMDAASRNGLLVFDYQSPDDFKYAAAAEGANQWIFGQKTTGGYQTLASFNEVIHAGRDYQIAVVLDGTSATLWVDGGVKSTYDYGTVVTDGRVGLAAVNASTEFDDFLIQDLQDTQAASPVSLPYEEDFEDQVDDFFEALGQWDQLADGYQADPGDGDTASLLSLDREVPYQFTLRAELKALRAESRSNNALLLFDYRSPVNYKFAGVAVGADQWVVGQRTSNGVTILDALSEQLLTDVAYDLELLVEGRRVSVISGGEVKVEYLFDSLVNGGRLGLGSVNSYARFDDVAVAAVAPLDDDFVDLLPVNGRWSSSAGRLSSDLLVGEETVQLVHPSSSLSFPLGIAATVNAGMLADGLSSNALLLFDFENLSNFKFAGLAAGSDRWVVGHRSAGQTMLDAVLDTRLSDEADYEIELHLDGSTATLLSDGQTVLSHNYAEAITDGEIGFGSINSRASFASIAIGALGQPAPASIPLQLDFSESAIPLVPQLGIAAIDSGAFELTSLSGADAISRIALNDSLPSAFEIRSTLLAAVASGERSSNALLLFDLEDAQHYKFAGLAASSGRWVIGHRRGSNVELMADATDNVAPGVSYPVRVEIDGNMVRLFANGELKVQTAYEEPLNNGQLGLGSVDSNARFDDLAVEETV